MPRISLLVIGLFFIVAGVSHFLWEDFFIMAMPDYLGYHKELVLISGAFEILGAIGILVPQTRIFSGYGLIALMVAVYPANINMALHPEKYPEFSELFLYVRLPFQFLFIWFVWWSIKPEKITNKLSET